MLPQVAHIAAAVCKLNFFEGRKRTPRYTAERVFASFLPGYIALAGPLEDGLRYHSGPALYAAFKNESEFVILYEHPERYDLIIHEPLTEMGFRLAGLLPSNLPEYRQPSTAEAFASLVRNRLGITFSAKQEGDTLTGHTETEQAATALLKLFKRHGITVTAETHSKYRYSLPFRALANILPESSEA